ncbi:MAG: flavin reductase [Candidatus Omnitrophota bacterium]
MNKTFKRIKPEEIRDNPFQAIGQEWMLILAGSEKKYNMMTASWGAWGVLWHKPAAFCFIRPQRYTYEFMEKARVYSLNFFDAEYKKVLDLCGSKSGRAMDKPKEAGLTALSDEKSGALYFREARLVLICKKIYFQQIDPEHFLDPSIEANYPQKDYHRMYAGEVIACLEKKPA